MASKEIEVLESDIKFGKANGCWDCPVALALQRAFNNIMIGVWYSGVDTPNGVIDQSRFFTNISSALVELPTEVAVKITAFDKGEAIKPFSFTLEY
jgi:hypothetical protein